MSRCTDTTTRKKLADGLRALAKKGEEIEATCNFEAYDRSANGVDLFFTCNEVEKLGGDVKGRYRDLFLDNTYDLWRDEPRYVMSRRILALCFMAAMVEAGDA